MTHFLSVSVLPLNLGTARELGRSLPGVYQIQYYKEAHETRNANIVHAMAKRVLDVLHTHMKPKSCLGAHLSE